MDDIAIPGVEDSKNAFKTFQSFYGPPAYVRRARETEAAFDELVCRCRKQRDAWLPMVRLRLGMLKGLAGDWAALRPCLADEEQVRSLERMHVALDPQLRTPVVPTSSRRRLRRALRELRESIELFNRRWQTYLRAVDLRGVNELRDGYNRYYLVEKECALRSPRLAREGFVRLEPLTAEALFALLPLLPVPTLAK